MGLLQAQLLLESFNERVGASLDVSQGKEVWHQGIRDVGWGFVCAEISTGVKRQLRLIQREKNRRVLGEVAATKL